jgi:hypothetical protein
VGEVHSICERHGIYVVIERHNIFETMDENHRDDIGSRLSLDASTVWRLSCLFIARDIAVHLRRRSMGLQTLAYGEDAL